MINYWFVNLEVYDQRLRSVNSLIFGIYLSFSRSQNSKKKKCPGTEYIVDSVSIGCS